MTTFAMFVAFLVFVILGSLLYFAAFSLARISLGFTGKVDALVTVQMGVLLALGTGAFVLAYSVAPFTVSFGGAQP